MRLVIAIILVVFSCTAVAAGSSELDKCTKTLSKVESSLGALDLHMVNTLLTTVNSTCLSSVEYSEWSNELIFAAATAKPGYFIIAFGKQPHVIQMNILREMESPINDGIDLQKTYQAISSVPESSEKLKVLAAIKNAAAKIGLNLWHSR